MKKIIRDKMHYGYEDVFIIPTYSEVHSRGMVDTTVKFESKNSDLTLELKVPVISANMDTVTEHEMAIALHKAGAIGALHRFLSIEDNVKEYSLVKEAGAECFVSIGVGKDYKERTTALYDAGARFFIVDIAHGHSVMMKNTLTWLREKFGRSIFVVAGNATTRRGVVEIQGFGADCVKVGVGPGAACATKDVTGVTMPIFTAVNDCSDLGCQIIADGGLRVFGDVAKAVGAGATAVMSGYFFAGCDEVPAVAKQVTMNGETFIYRGMASAEAMKRIRNDNLPTPEGKLLMVNPKGSATNVVANIAGGLRSAYSYIGAINTEDFVKNVEFGLRIRG